MLCTLYIYNGEDETIAALLRLYICTEDLSQSLYFSLESIDSGRKERGRERERGKEKTCFFFAVFIDDRCINFTVFIIREKYKSLENKRILIRNVELEFTSLE